MTKPLVSHTTIALSYLAWWMLWMAVQTYAMLHAGFDWETALTDASITQLIYAVAGYTMNTSMQAYQPGRRTAIFVLMRAIVLSVICLFAQQFILEQVNAKTPGYEAFLGNTLAVRGTVGLLMMMLVAILTWFWVYVTERTETEQRKEDAMKLSREAELSQLRQQLQPHFLFNSLNSISALVVTRPEEARSMIQQLSDFLRGTVKKEDGKLVKLEEEMKHLQLYLDIEKVRFGHRLRVEILKNDDCMAHKLPSLLLQPIVENAIKFGLYDTVGEITVSVKAAMEGTMLQIEIKNPFDPETSVTARGTGFGLSSVKRRLYLLYHRNDLLLTSQQGGEFTTTIRIPPSI
ncbi:histidine kinase [uncultured Imperialibacter sp.]|uniref:sensor histidine kinase n=1 Tax=uncultured Imperialibacter sp. TaxID=1672639 RepID=UPI0030DD02C7|tara:strand:+ start:6696 stop:7736 length:1041 start_codon:yes stop_codon:yes gene_type:complete